MTVLGMGLYLVAFYATDARRRMLLNFLLVPEELVHSWVANDWSRFGILDHFPVLAGAAVIWALSGLTGWLVLDLLNAGPQLTQGERRVISIAVGLNIWSLVTLLVGLCGGLQDRGVFGALACLAVGLAIWRRWRRRDAAKCSPESPTESSSESRSSSPQLTWFGRLAGLLCVPFGVMILLGGTLPAGHFDVREYHLQVPKEWFQQGRITFLPHNVYGNMPLGAELHAVLGMLLARGHDDWWWGALVGKTVIAAFALLGAAGVFFLGRRARSSDTGAWGAFAYLSAPWVGHVSMTGLIDGAVACYVVLATAVALLGVFPEGGAAPHVLKRSLSLFAIAGFLAGSAVACKYPALLFLAIPLGVLVTVRPRQQIDWKAAVVYTAAVIAGCGLWFGKNWVQSGNPTYPLLYGVFGGESWNAEKNERWTTAHGPPRDADGNRFSGTQLLDSLRVLTIQSDHHSPWLVPLALAAFWVWPSDRSRPWLWILSSLIGFAVVSWWFLTHRLDRFLVPMLPLMAVLAGIGATWSEDRSWRRAIVLFGCWCCLSSFLHIASGYAADNRILVSLRDLRSDRPPESDRSMTRMNDGHRWLNEHVPKGYRALLVGEAQVFDLEVPILYNTCFDDCVLETLLRGRSRDERRTALREQRISHIFVSWYELNRYRSPGNYGYSDFPTRALFHRELTAEQGLLRPVPLVVDPQILEIFEVVDE